MSRPLRLGYISIDNPDDRDAWSGTTRAMMQGLRDAGASVEPIIATAPALELASKAHAMLVRQWTSGKHMRQRETWYLKAVGALVARRANGRRFDAFVSPGTLPVSYAQLDAPLFIWTDASLPSMENFYPSFTGLAERTIRQGRAAEQACFERCHTAVFSSAWAARGAVDAYGIANVADIRFGANLAPPPIRPDAAAKATGWSTTPRFLLVGKDWHVKGGDRAVAVVNELRRRGYDARLRVIGAEVPNPPAGNWFSWAGFVSKNATNGPGFLASEYANAHMLMILSRADCTPMVVAEAASFGVPALGSAVGGIPEQIQDQVSGLVTDRPDDAVAVADALEPCLRAPTRFQKLVEGALEQSAATLNWRTAAERMLALIRSGLDSAAA